MGNNRAKDNKMFAKTGLAIKEGFALFEKHRMLSKVISKKKGLKNDQAFFPAAQNKGYFWGLLSFIFSMKANSECKKSKKASTGSAFNRLCHFSFFQFFFCNLDSLYLIIIRISNNLFQFVC